MENQLGSIYLLSCWLKFIPSSYLISIPADLLHGFLAKSILSFNALTGHVYLLRWLPLLFLPSWNQVLKTALSLNNAFRVDRVDVKSTRGEVGSENAISAVAANPSKMKDFPRCLVVIATFFAVELASIL